MSKPLQLHHFEHTGITAIRGLPFNVHALTAPAKAETRGLPDMLAMAAYEANEEALRRLAASWNVCAGIPTNQLEVTDSLEHLWADAFRSRDKAEVHLAELRVTVARQQAALDWLVAVQGRRLAEQQAELSTARRTREQRDELLAMLERVTDAEYGFGELGGWPKEDELRALIRSMR